MSSKSFRISRLSGESIPAREKLYLLLDLTINGPHPANGTSLYFSFPYSFILFHWRLGRQENSFQYYELIPESSDLERIDGKMSETGELEVGESQVRFDVSDNIDRIRWILDSFQWDDNQHAFVRYVIESGLALALSSEDLAIEFKHRTFFFPSTRVTEIENFRFTGKSESELVSDYDYYQVYARKAPRYFSITVPDPSLLNTSRLKIARGFSSTESQRFQYPCKWVNDAIRKVLPRYYPFGSGSRIQEKISDS